MQLAIDKKVPVVTTGAGNPAPFIEDMKAAGIKVIPVVPSVALAVRMQRYGADAVVFEGTEAGGHIGELTTMAALPQVVDAVDIPVVAAGGIADARGLAAAFCLGAQGVQMGTRLLATEEVRLHPNYVDRVLKAKDRDAIVSGRSTGHPVRALKTGFSCIISNGRNRAHPQRNWKRWVPGACGCRGGWRCGKRQRHGRSRWPDW